MRRCSNTIGCGALSLFFPFGFLAFFTGLSGRTLGSGEDELVELDEDVDEAI